VTEISANIYTSKLLDLVGNGDSIFLVMNQGASDFQFLMDHVEITEDTLITLLYNMLCATSFLHSANIIHRDIKPKNLLVDENCQVTICDFGLSRTMHKLDRQIMKPFYKMSGGDR
jgi:serine/threonine protein kinase